MNIIIHNAEVLDQDHLNACIQRIQQWVGTADGVYFHPDCDIYCNERTRDGWLEYTVKIAQWHGGYIYIGAIQRELGAAVEFHS